MRKDFAQTAKHRYGNACLLAGAVKFVTIPFTDGIDDGVRVVLRLEKLECTLTQAWIPGTGQGPSAICSRMNNRQTIERIEHVALRRIPVEQLPFALAERGEAPNGFAYVDMDILFLPGPVTPDTGNQCRLGGKRQCGHGTEGNTAWYDRVLSVESDFSASVLSGLAYLRKKPFQFAAEIERI
ncbi:hypothetical protein HED49_20040 [Ochrobactrum daejeonense]|nr:hypothetical protein [Brucella daejeonensis]